MTTLSDYLSGLEAVEAKATKGEWEAFDVFLFCNSKMVAEAISKRGCLDDEANATAIASAKNNLPKLIAIVRAFEKAVESAPHGSSCAILQPAPLDRNVPKPVCTCWKSATLARVGEIVKGTKPTPPNE